MSDLKYLIKKSTITGTVKVPASKSISHRIAICAALTNGTTTIENPLISDDIKATVNALGLLGAKIHRFDEKILEIEGPISRKENITIDCGESGSTLRFLIPIAAAVGGKIRFTGTGRLPKRRIKELLDVLRELGTDIDSDCLPLTVSGRIKRRNARIRGDISSQFVSGLLFAFALLGEESTIELTKELESKPYVDLTIDALERFGIQIYNDAYRKFKLPEMQRMIPGKFYVDSDYSSASFMLAAAALAGQLFIRDIKFPSKQGDSEVVNILKKMGAEIERSKGGLEVKKGALQAVEINASDIPDAVPILTVVATQAKGKTRITNAGRLRDKESDRLAAITKELRKMGANIIEKHDGLEIIGPVKLNGAIINPHGDHRIAMACSVAALIANGETTIENPECVKKSYPRFFKDLASVSAESIPITNELGKKLRISIYGTSHGKRIGVKITGVPKGLEINEKFIQTELDKRRSYGQLSTARKEKDRVRIISGIEKGVATGKEVVLEIENKDVKSRDYEKILAVPRPGHADYTAFVKYGGIVDMRGGGFFSGRMTACMVMAGAIAKKMLHENGVKIYAYTKQIGKIKLQRELKEHEMDKTYEYETKCPDSETSEKMKEEILNAKKENDSLGGIVECVVNGVPVGIGEPLFDSIESALSHAIFSIPAVKGVEFGSGFAAASMKGSEHNDEYLLENGKIVTKTNNSGGIQGGLTNGMPIVFRISIKPTASIGKKQNSVNIRQMNETQLEIEGRHDPCIAVRAPVVVESLAAIVLADFFMRR